MPGKYTERSLIEFQKDFTDNNACAKHPVDQRSFQQFRENFIRNVVKIHVTRLRLFISISEKYLEITL